MPEDAQPKERKKIPPYTQMTLKALRGFGYVADVAEKWLPFHGGLAGGVRKDLFDFIDIVALQAGKGIIAVQSTSDNCRCVHRKQLLANPNVKTWLLCGGHVVLWTWKKMPVIKADGTEGKAERWVARKDEIHLGDLE